MQTPLFAQLLAPGDALRGFLIKQCRFAGATAGLRQACHQKCALIPSLTYRDEHVQRDFPAWFEPVAAAVYLAALYRLLGDRAGFIDARRPQPFVQAYTATRGRFIASHLSTPAATSTKKSHLTARIPAPTGGHAG